jgi:pimeloyl-ACP methyl ester carboxylesterase
MPNTIGVNGTELEYQLRGTRAGEPVVLIHWGVAATWAEPLLDQPALASRYQLLSYHRAGFAGSGPLQGPPAMAAHAAHCQQLMRELGITRAHIQQWPFTEDDARRIRQPALAVLGTASPAIFAERHKLLLHWLPNAEPLDLPGLTHLLHAQDPAAVADGLTGFFARHPIPEPP